VRVSRSAKLRVARFRYRVGSPSPVLWGDDEPPGEGFYERVVAHSGVDHRVGAEASDLGQRVVIAAGGYNASRAEQPGDLHGETSGDAGRALDQDGLARGEAGCGLDRKTGHGRRDHDGDGRVDALGRGGRVRCWDDGALGQRAVGRARLAEPDESAVGKGADPVEPDDRRQLREELAGREVGARRDRLVDVLHRDGLHLDHDLAVT